jgi:hypothetical protein
LYCNAYLIISIVKIIQSENEVRLYLSIIFIITIIILNTLEFAFFHIIVNPINLITSKVKLKRKKKSFNRKLTDKTKLRLTTILLFSYILVSFSFEYIISIHNFTLIGVSTFAIILLYLITALYDVFIYQKNIFLASEKLETFMRRIEGENEGNSFIKSSIAIIFSFENLVKHLRNEKETNVGKTLKWVKNNIERLPYITKLGFSLFKSYLTIKLIFIVLATLIFFVIVNANYIKGLEDIGLLSSDLEKSPEYLLTSFYLFIGESIDYFRIISYKGYLSLYILSTGMMGWLLTITYIVLFFDILSLSISDFYEKLSDANTKVIEQGIDAIAKLEKLTEDDLNKNLNPKHKFRFKKRTNNDSSENSDSKD